VGRAERCPPPHAHGPRGPLSSRRPRATDVIYVGGTLAVLIAVGVIIALLATRR
jgi:hypothetical protein